MPKSIQLSIPEPCHEGWDKMTQAEKGRFCQSCQKIVVDFTRMSDKQIIEYISKASSQTCGHFYNDQLNRAISETKEPKKSWWRRGWNVAAASLLFSTASYAQGNVRVKKVKPLTVQKDSKQDEQAPMLDGFVSVRYSLIGRILDAITSEPIEGVTIDTDQKFGAVLSDASGIFRTKLLPTERKTDLNVSAIGYKTRKVPVSINDTQLAEPLTIYLDREYIEMDSVVVRGLSIEKCFSVTTGFTIMVRPEQISLFDKLVTNPLVSKIVDSFSSVKIYPNPAIAGSVLNIQMDFSEKGPYKLELYNPVGQLVQLREIDIIKDQQLVTLPLEKNLTKGMYIVRINHQESKKRYTKKVIVN